MSESLISSFLVSDVSDSLTIAQVAHQKWAMWAIMSESHRSLTKNERIAWKTDERLPTPEFMSGVLRTRTNEPLPLKTSHWVTSQPHQVSIMMGDPVLEPRTSAPAAAFMWQMLKHLHGYYVSLLVAELLNGIGKYDIAALLKKSS